MWGVACVLCHSCRWRAGLSLSWPTGPTCASSGRTGARRRSWSTRVSTCSAHRRSDQPRMWKVSGLAGLWQGRGRARTGAAGPWSSGGSRAVARRARRPGLRRLLGLRGLLHRALLRPSRRWAAQDGGAAGRSAAGAAPSPSGSLANCKELTLGDKACCAEATGVTARQASKPSVNRREQSARESSGSETNALCRSSSCCYE